MPFAEGNTITGWGVVQPNPWVFVGIFPTKDQAEAEAKSRGPDYVVRYGDNQEGTDNFVWDSLNNPEGSGV